MTSPDGANWTPRVSPLANLINITYSPENSEFVVVGNGGGVQTSPDGITWTAVPVATTNNWRGVTWSPGLYRYVSVASSGTDRVLVGLVPKVSSAPLDLAIASTTSSGINLTWNPPYFNGNSAITGYRIERSVNGGAFETLVANTTATTTTYSDTSNIAAGRQYSYRIYALNSEGQSSTSNTVVTDVAAAAAVSQLADTGTNQYAIMLLASVFLLLSAAMYARKRKMS